MDIHPQTPVLIGFGEYTDRSAAAEGLGPVEIMKKSAEQALTDSGAYQSVLQNIDSIGLIGMVTDAPDARLKTGNYPNMPRTLGDALGAPQSIHPLYTCVGGNSPQMLVNHCAERIAENDFNCTLIAGCEVLKTLVDRLKGGIPMDDWSDERKDDREILGTHAAGNSEFEQLHHLSRPTNIYPLFETALRAHYKRTPAQHQQAIGNLFERFNAVASQNPLSWFPQRRTAEEIALENQDNRWVGYPYPKYLNSIIQVNMSAALVMCSVAKAQELGIAEDKWVYLHGCSDLYENWYVSERESLHKAPALAAMGRQAMDMAQISGADELDYLDIYSCFPSAVQVACDELGIDQERPLTLTGGLPYFGGPGNNYSMHGIAAAMRCCRTHPQARVLSTANGWYLTKHSCGIYSSTPFQGRWQRPPSLQTQFDQATKKVPLEHRAEGNFTIEAYTLIHDRNGPEMGIFIGRLDNGKRSLANMSEAQEGHWDYLMHNEGVGLTGTISPDTDGRNLFTLKSP